MSKKLELDAFTVESFETAFHPAMGGVFAQSIVPDSLDCSQNCNETNNCGATINPSCNRSCFPPNTSFCQSEWMMGCNAHTEDAYCQTNACC